MQKTRVGFPTFSPGLIPVTSGGQNGTTKIFTCPSRRRDGAGGADNGDHLVVLGIILTSVPYF